MGKRRSDNPLTILVLGLFLIGGFGACLVFLNEKTPILQLRPEVVKQFELGDLHARFRVASPGSPAAVVLELEDDLGAARHAEVADWALRKYVELALASRAGRTSVVQCEVQVKGDTRPRYVLRRSQLEARDQALHQREALASQLARLGLQHPKIEVGGYTPTGVEVRAEAEVSGRARRPRLAQRALELLERQAFAGQVRVELRGDPPLVLEGGRDRPPAPKPSPGPSPSPAPDTAPVGS